MARTPQFTSWSPSRLADHDQCPLMAKLKHLDKLCPACFDGKIMGGFATPAVCDSCKKVVKKGDALVRGTAIGGNLEGYVNGTKKTLHKEIRHPVIKDLAKDLRAGFKEGLVKVEYNLVLDRNWKVCDPRDWNNAWLRSKLDVYQQIDMKTVKVIDWKTGSIDKRDGSVRQNPGYVEQLEIYCTVALCLFPAVEVAEAELAFVDCGPAHNPIVKRTDGPITRKKLPVFVKQLTRRALPMLSDKSFSPRASDKCRWCDFSKGKGGPCPY